MFINLVDKKKEQGALGEAFDAALKAVADGAGRENVPENGADANNSVASVSNDGGERGGEAPESNASGLAGSLRHVWFDFHHEVCTGVRSIYVSPQVTFIVSAAAGH